MALIDPHGRKINYLRLSVTDRCNLRCRYCMPEAGIVKCGHKEILTFEQLYDIAAAATSLGIEKIRITGGEPLVRKGILPFLDRLSSLDGLRELVLTTNGTLLSSMAHALRDAGVKRLNISLDSLQPDTFRQITRRGYLSDVFDGIEAAEDAGLPVKLNTVVMRGINDEEIDDFIRLTLHAPVTVRFIEYMPVIKESGWQSLVVPGNEILERISAAHDLEGVESARCAGPARIFRVKGATGSFGLITPLSGHFCDQCNRIRVSSDGHASSCLFSDRRVDLRSTLKGGRSACLISALERMVGGKPARHQLSTSQAPHTPFVMANIGG